MVRWRILALCALASSKRSVAESGRVLDSSGFSWGGRETHDMARFDNIQCDDAII